MTRFLSYPRWFCGLILLAAAALVALSSFQTNYRPMSRSASLAAPVTDGRLYASIVEKVRAGSDYYSVAAETHRAMGYPTSPPQVFREPTAAVLLAAIPFPALRWAALIAASLAAVFAARAALARTSIEPRTQLYGLLAMTIGLSNVGMPDAPYMHEVWAAIFIVISISAYQCEKPLLAVLCGLIACLVRELSLPVIIAMCAADLWERRFRQAGYWAAAGLIFVLVYALHLQHAASLHAPGDVTSPGWLGLGGWRFVLLTARRDAFLALAPAWTVATVVVLSVLGLVGCRDRWVGRVALIVVGYLLAMTVVGRPDTDYWGILWAPLLPLGLAMAPNALRDLFHQATSRTVPAG